MMDDYPPFDSEEQAEERDFDGFSSGYAGSLQEGQLYAATLTGMKERRIKSKFSDDEDGKAWVIIWTFVIDDPREPVELMSSKAQGEASKAARLVLIPLTGRNRWEDRGRNPYTKLDLIGRECSLTVEFSDSGWPKVSTVLASQTGAATTPSAHVEGTPLPAANSGADLDDLPF